MRSGSGRSPHPCGKSLPQSPHEKRRLHLHARQAKLINRLLDGFDGRLTSSRWSSIAKCSPDTVLRDINGLIALGMLRKAAGGGRSTAYELAGEEGDGAQAPD